MKATNLLATVVSVAKSAPRAALIGFALMPVGCSNPGSLPSSVTQSFEQAFNRDDLQACVALFTDDAQILPQHGSIITGQRDIEAFLKDQISPIISYNTETDMTLVRGDLGIEQGHYRVRDIRRGSDIEEGKYLHVWRLVNGRWKLHRVIWNTDFAPPAIVTIDPSMVEPSGT